jgi:hypothetical protein
MTITPQEPGAIIGVDSDRLTDLAAQSVAEIVDVLDTLDTNEVEQLLILEKQGEARVTAIRALERELDGRLFPGDEPAPPISNELHPYRNKRAKDVDRSKLDRNVLTLDGWVMPIPVPGAEI